MALAHGNPADLLPDHYKEQIKAWFAEDAPSFDYGMASMLTPQTSHSQRSSLTKVAKVASW